MNINKELIEGKYQEIKSLGKNEGFIDKKSFGEIKLFINKKPPHVLFEYEIENDTLYVGTN